MRANYHRYADTLFKRVKRAAAQRKTTFRALVVDALERSLAETPQHFELEDAALGSRSPDDRVGKDAINQAIDKQRQQGSGNDRPHQHSGACAPRGRSLQDARIAACCLDHGVTGLWTVDRDFGCFPSLKTKNPLNAS